MGPENGDGMPLDVLELGRTTSTPLPDDVFLSARPLMTDIPDDTTTTRYGDCPPLGDPLAWKAILVMNRTNCGKSGLLYEVFPKGVHCKGKDNQQVCERTGKHIE